MHLLRELIKHMRGLIEKTKALSLHTVYERLIAYLESRAEKLPDGIRIVRDRFTHAELARRIGASREMVSRVMRDLSAGGYICAEKERLVLQRQFPRSW